jgi:hypothetical protein
MQKEVIVKADPDLDDCLTGAAEAYVAEHPELAGWDLAPRWTDESDRETVTLTVPEQITKAQIRALSNEAGEHGDLDMVAICERALEGDAEALVACERAIGEARARADG